MGYSLANRYCTCFECLVCEECQTDPCICDQCEACGCGLGDDIEGALCHDCAATEEIKA